MTEACTTSTLPATGTPLPTTALPATGKVVGMVGGAVRRANHVRRGVRRFRRAVTIVTCVTLGGAAAATGLKALLPLGGYGAAPAVRVLTGSGQYRDYAAPNPSGLCPSYLPAVSGYSQGTGGAGWSGAGGNDGATAPNRHPAAVPEPSSRVLFVSAILGVLGLREASPRSPRVVPDADQKARRLWDG